MIGFNRRQFISGCLATAATGRDAGAADTPAAIDPNLVVIISDIHVALPWSEQRYRTGREYPHVNGMICRLVKEILSLRPLPANVIDLGDISLAFSEEREYALCRQFLKPLEDAGIKVTHTLGNHDRTAEFLAVFPEYAERVRFGNKIVSEVSTPHADFILLDSHVECAEDERGRYSKCTGHGCGKEQLEWLSERVASATKPTFLCAHHPVGETGAAKTALSAPSVFGYLHGHWHRWTTNYMNDGYGKNAKIMMQMCFPSFGLDSDVGYGVMRISENRAKVACITRDYYFPVPAEFRQKEGGSGRRPASWDAFRDNWNGRRITFAFDK